ncbi:MAG: ATP-binding protein [Gemmatimonadales bacterium]|nr:ATP-binding protein [Gemmatimonadales bacterium]
MAERDLLVAANRAAVVARTVRWLIHEIRNPIQVLSLAPELIDEPEAVPSVRLMLLEGTQRLIGAFDLLEHLLRLPPTASAPAPLTLHGPLDFMARVYAFHRSPTRLDVDEGEGLPAVRAVEQHLIHILLNLVHNALAAQADRVDGWIRLELRAMPAGVMLRCHDGGPGVAPGVAGRLFEPYVTTKEAGPLAGLGLHVARTLAREMGGELAWEGGSTFALHLAAWQA